MSTIDIAAILISCIAALGSWASHRAAAKATTRNADTSARVDMEKEAYQRARKLDTDTIDRQDQEMLELREENIQLKLDNKALHREIGSLKSDNEDLHDEIAALKRRVKALEGSANDNQK